MTSVLLIATTAAVVTAPGDLVDDGACPTASTINGVTLAAPDAKSVAPLPLAAGGSDAPSPQTEAAEPRTDGSGGDEDAVAETLRLSLMTLTASLRRVLAKDISPWTAARDGDTNERDPVAPGAVVTATLSADSGRGALSVATLGNARVRLWKALSDWRGRILVLEGVIGAGKSTLCRSIKVLCKALGVPCKVLNEGVPDELLKLFLSDPKRHAFTFQVALLYRRVAQHARASELVSKGFFVVQDRSLVGDSVFVLQAMRSGSMSADNLRDYSAILGREKRLRRADATLYLVTSDAVAKDRVSTRDRPGECAHYLVREPWYLARNVDCYDQLFRHIATHDAALAQALCIVPLDWNAPPPVVPWRRKAPPAELAADLQAGRLGTPAALSAYSTLLETVMARVQQK